MGYPYVPPKNPRAPDPNQPLPVPMGNSPASALMARQPTYSNPVSSGQYQDLAMRLAGAPPQMQPRPVMDLPPLRAAPNDSPPTTTTTPGLGSYLGTALQGYQLGDNLGLFGSDPSQAETSAERGARDTSGTNAAIDASIGAMTPPALGPVEGAPAGETSISDLGGSPTYQLPAALGGAGAAAGLLGTPAGTVAITDLGTGALAGGGSAAAVGGGASADAVAGLGGASTGLGALGTISAGLGAVLAPVFYGMNVIGRSDREEARQAQIVAERFFNAHPNATVDDYWSAVRTWQDNSRRNSQVRGDQQ